VSRLPRRPTLFLTIALSILGFACSTAPTPGAAPRSPVLAARSAGVEIFDLSPLRGRIRSLRAQAFRLMAPHWSEVRESDRGALQLAVARTLSEDRIAPLVRARLEAAAAARPDLAAAALEWLRSPLGFEVKFAEATAWTGERSSEDIFFTQYAEVRDQRTPEIRMERIRRLAEVAGSVESTLDLTSSVGLAAARVVNHARPGRKPLADRVLRETVERERDVPAVIEAYRPVVEASLLVRCRDLTLQDLDHYLEFAATDAGLWYHELMSSSLSAAVDEAGAGIVAAFDEIAHAERPDQKRGAGGFNLDSLQLTLPSGRKVRLLGLAAGGAGSKSAVVLRYETTLALEDGAAVGAEAREVWDHVRRDLETEGAKAAVLQAIGSVDGWVFPFASTRKFAWARDQEGTWRELTDTRSPFGTVEREMLCTAPP
jgi:hypothetical protein